MNAAPAPVHRGAATATPPAGMTRGCRANPFASHRVASHELPYLTPAGAPSAESLAALLSTPGARGLVLVGPHGAGKSTLLRHVARAVATATGRRSTDWLCRDDQPDLPPLWRFRLPPAGGLLTLDGGERTRPSARRALVAACVRRRCMLLATAHAPDTFPGLPESPVAPCADMFEALVAALLEGHPPPHLAASARPALAARAGDARLALWDLYDRYELAGPREPPPHAASPLT